MKLGMVMVPETGVMVPPAAVIQSCAECDRTVPALLRA